jgi:hypothetical protein
MRYYFILLFILIASPSAFTQVSNSTTHINTKFEIHLDSIERKVTVNKWGTDSSYYLHYTVTNISKYALTYVTNSCFYYNHYSLKVGQHEFDLNPSGGCLFNETTPHSLAPGESFNRSEWITAANLNTLTKGEWSVTLSIPLVKDDEKTYRVDGRTFVENEEYLIFVNQTKIIETYINNRKRKKNST